MNQPIKNIINYQKFLSKELTNIFNNIKLVFLDEYPVNEITSEYFLFTSLLDKDTLLYRTLSSFLTFDTITNIYDRLAPEIMDSLVTILKPGRDIPFSDDFRLALNKSYEIMVSMNLKLITSDILLLSFISNNKHIKQLFEEEGLTYEIAMDSAMKLHDALVEITEDEEPEEDKPKAQPIQIQVIDPNNIGQTNITNLIGNMFGGPQPKNKKNGYISTYCTNLNELAERGEIDDLIGRNDEIDTIVNIINRRKNNNVIIVGQSGAGKTQLVYGLAKNITSKNCSMCLYNTTVLKLNVNELMSGTSLRGMFEERIIGLTKELATKKNILLFIDDFHHYINDKKKEEYDFGSLISSLLENNNVKVIATTTQNGYKLLTDNNKELSRKFQKLNLQAPSFEENITILNGIKHIYEKYHKVVYSEEAIIACVKTSERYIPEISLPSSAIDILDETGASKKISIYNNENVKETLNKIDKLKKCKDDALRDDDIDAVNAIKEIIDEEEKDLGKYYNSLLNDKTIRMVTEDDIYKTISKHTGIEVSKMSKSEMENLSEMSNNIKKEIIGQDEAVDAVTKAIKRSKVGLYPKNRPIMSCMCIGSTGVGKTLLAKKLAKEVFGSETNMLRFDMSEYADKTSLNKLIGSSAGYVGYDKGGLLTEAVRNKKHTVLLIDEIEKADEGIFNLFLQIFDEGFITDNSGNKVDFKNTIIIITSNVGAKKANNEKGIGFNVDDNVNKKDIIERELKKKFPPEFINRIDEIVYFNSLNENTLKKIIELELNKLIDKLFDMSYNMSYDNNVIDYIYKVIEKDKDYGARPILRAIQNEIENKITDIIIDDKIINNRFNVTAKDNVINIE